VLEIRNLRRTVNQAMKHPEPVMEVDAPWNTDDEDFNYVNVLYDETEGLFNMWYAVLVRKERGCAARTWAYATSTDGIHWDRPILNRVEVNGSTQNNYFLPPLYELCWTVLIDPSDPPSRRYKMIFTVADNPEDGAGVDWAATHVPLSLAYSADGITWSRPVHVNPVMRGVSDAGFTSYYDPKRRKYVLFTRRVPNLPRDVSMHESFDLVTWEDRGRVLVAGDEHDPPSLFNIQTLTGFPYEDLHLGLLNVHYTLPGAEPYEARHAPPDDYDDPRMGLVDVQLACSRDGQVWSRPLDRSAIIPNGEPGSRDAGIIFVPQCSPPVINGETWIYYTACQERHSIWDWRAVEAKGRSPRCCMLARMPEDHWASLDAGEEEGTVLTKPIELGDGHEILLNADAGGGAVTGELVAPGGRIVEGFARGDCVSVSGNGKDQPLKWRGSTNACRPREVCIRLFVGNAKLYSLSFGERAK
jgi:hypothetical protein